MSEYVDGLEQQLAEKMRAKGGPGPRQVARNQKETTQRRKVLRKKFGDKGARQRYGDDYGA